MATVNLTVTSAAEPVTVHRLWSMGVDLWAMAKPGGVKVGINPTDAKTSGRSEGNALMHRQIVAVKDKITVPFRNLTPEEAAAVSALVYRTFIPVDYVSPRYGARTNIMFYAQINAPALTNPMRIKGRWVPWSWEGLELTLVEQ